MKPRIVWSKWAKEDIRHIQLYWNKRNHSDRYSRKIVQAILGVLENVYRFPKIAETTNAKGLYSVLALNYRVLYFTMDNTIVVFMVWDMRRDPDELEKSIWKRLAAKE